ncbi:hypothetical protein [Streptomyces sp. NPDC058572]|uniref:hypothetical protein n=1 Tax=Streptomyces sp. NPDC058572 TaxID=3346546 RepID=UPI00365F47CF
MNPEHDPAAAEPSAQPSASPSRVRRIIGIALPVALVLGTVGGGIAYTKVTVDDADRTAPTAVWEKADGRPAEDPAGDVSRGRASTPLSKLLLPVPAGYHLGPDIEGHGNDSELSAQQATALLKEEGRGLSGRQRRNYERGMDKLGVQGIALRSLASDEGDLLVEIQVTRMKNKKQLHDLFELKTELSQLLRFPKGPAIKGHKKSACFLMPQENKDLPEKEKSKLDAMACSAYDSELLVSVTASGTKPFDKAAVAELVKDQLDHISSPGEYV